MDKGTCGAHLKIFFIYIYIYIILIRRRGADLLWPNVFIFFIFFLSLLSSIYGNRTVGIRRGKKQSALLDEGYV